MLKRSVRIQQKRVILESASGGSIDHDLALVVDADAVELAPGYTNGSALIEGFVPITPDDQAGWQLQGSQWRLAVRVVPGSSLHGRGDDLKMQREDYVRENYLDHFDFSTLDDVSVSVTGSASRREFLHFAPDFVYQRKQLAHPTVGQLEELAFRTTRRLLALSK
jgi:hypothetical protein